jgi:hypothetical protein
MKVGYAASALVLLVSIVSAHADAQTRVRGYTRKDGTYVAPHYRSSPNSSKSDNYSTRGNYNPYTGKKGSVDPYALPAYSAPRYTAPSYSAPSYTTTPTYTAPAPTRYVPPKVEVDRWWAKASEPTLAPLPAPDPNARERAQADLNALGERLKESDPFYEVRLPELLKQAPAVMARLPPEQWTAAAERIYWAIPATKASMVSTYALANGPISLAGGYGAPVCQALEDARANLEYAASALLRCARQMDYSDDCSREVRDARDAGDEYETEVSNGLGICE